MSAKPASRQLSPEETERITSPLVRYAGEQPPAPSWFLKALADEPSVHFVAHAGTELEVLAWGKAGGARTPVLLVHGSGANGDWWRFIAPYLTGDRGVVAMTLSGMGRSGWSPTYSFDDYADQIIAVAERQDLFNDIRPPVIVGHSMGGMIGMLAATRPQARFAGVLAIDSNVIGYVPPQDWRVLESGLPSEGAHWPTYKVYPTISEALARFRLLPPQPSYNDYVTDYIARANLKQVDDGWTWRSDPKLRYLGQEPDFFARRLHLVRCPFAVARGARSRLISADHVRNMLAAAPPGTAFFEIPEADHHVMIDQPLATAAALDAFLAVWADFTSPVAGSWSKPSHVPEDTNSQAPDADLGCRSIL